MFWGKKLLIRNNSAGNVIADMHAEYIQVLPMTTSWFGEREI